MPWARRRSSLSYAPDPAIRRSRPGSRRIDGMMSWNPLISRACRPRRHKGDWCRGGAFRQAGVVVRQEVGQVRHRYGDAAAGVLADR